MPIELPNLDDKTYAELVQEALATLSGIHPDWTDHNPSDPGITLIELLAWLTEMLLYRTNQLPERSVRTFLSLLDGGTTPEQQQASLEEATRATMRKLRERWRAVTPGDYEYLAKYQWPGSDEARKLPAEAGPPELARVRCLAARDPVRLLVVQARPPGGEDPWEPPAALLEALTRFFRERQLIGMRFLASAPTYVPITIKATLHLRDDASAEDVGQRAPQEVLGYFEPWKGGRDGSGWPFGREVPASDVYSVLDSSSGVESVESVELVVADQPWGPRRVVANGRVVAIRLEPHELPRVTVALKLKERLDGEWG